MTNAERQKLRGILHELSNVLTGVLVSGGLLRLALRGDDREHYAKELCDVAERGADLVRHGRAILTGAEQTVGKF